MLCYAKVDALEAQLEAAGESVAREQDLTEQLQKRGGMTAEGHIIAVSRDEERLKLEQAAALEKKTQRVKELEARA